MHIPEAEDFLLLTAYLDYLKGCGRAEDTIKGIKGSLRLFRRRLKTPYREVQPEQLWDYVYENKLKAQSKQSRYHDLKGFYNWLEEEGKLLSSPMRLVEAPKMPIRLPKHVMTPGETEAMLEAIPADVEGIYAFRDRVMLELLYSCSLRRGELVSLDVQDYDASSSSLRIGAVTSKTRTGRIVPVGRRAIELLLQYLDERRYELVKHSTPAMFLNYSGNRISRTHVTQLVTKLRKQLKIKTKATSHSFRKSSATHMLRNKAPLISVSRLLGHTDISATVLYTKVYPQDIIRMHRAHHPREKQKNIKLPELELPMCYSDSRSTKILCKPHISAVLDQFSSRRHDELPELKIPLK